MGILVFGSFVVDLTSRCAGLPVPGQTLIGSTFVMGPGGKGSNQAVAAHRAGADVRLVTRIGGDVFARVATDFYEKEGMDTGRIIRDGSVHTGTALIMVDEASAQNMIVVTPGACAHFTPQDVEGCRDLLEGAGILLTQLEINFDALHEAIRIAHRAGVRVVLNPAPAAPVPDDVLVLVDVVTPNETEAEALTGVRVRDEDSARRAARFFLDRGVKHVVITLGEMGVYGHDGTRDLLLPRIPVKAVDTTGAGDAFSGAFVTALDEGKDLFGAMRFGNAAAALSVTRPGTAPSMPYREEIDRLYRENYPD